MNMLIIPQHVQIDVRFSVDSGLLALLQTIADKGNDRAKAAELSKEVKKTTEALAAAIPSP